MLGWRQELKPLRLLLLLHELLLQLLPVQMLVLGQCT
jgi:hypothetical protein